MAHVSHKLSNSFQGALAGGGDPATSPLYVFGPLLRLIVIAGVANVTFGATIWLTVLTVFVVSAMYRKVMTWVVDGSGGSGLSEEEFGSWAVKVNAAITFVEYTLTFLVSMAALVTFLSDRWPALEQSILLGIQYRSLVAIGLSLVTGWLVNRGPKAAARAFGPATAAVLLLLWVMIFASIWRLGFHLPAVNLNAFKPAYINFTLSGYAHILALMTGVEIFANLVAAYDGPPRQKSRKAFGSLLIIMGTTSLTMLIVGPAILQLSDPTNKEVSVFTQTMDRLLPASLSYAGTLIGVAVLLSACAASTQGVQNLVLGLRYRHYVPARFGQRNRHDVADRPVWLKVALVSFCFLAFGTDEGTYLALYAAGVFILLSMTGWAATKRLTRELHQHRTLNHSATLIGTLTAALLTSAATTIIFRERFTEGVWAYLLFVPALYLVFSYYRKRLGAPTSVEERLGLLIAEKRYLTEILRSGNSNGAIIETILVPLDGSASGEVALPTARSLAHAFDANLTLALLGGGGASGSNEQSYLRQIACLLEADGIEADQIILSGRPAEAVNEFARRKRLTLVVVSGNLGHESRQILSSNLTQELIQETTTPVILVPAAGDWRSRRSPFKRVLVSLDGSSEAERALPYLRLLAHRFMSEVLLLSVPEGTETHDYKQTIERYLANLAAVLSADGINVRTIVTGSGPARTILALTKDEEADLIMMATHGRGGKERLEHVTIGSVATRVAQEADRPVWLAPVREGIESASLDQPQSD